MTPRPKIQNWWQQAEAAGWFSAIAELRPIMLMGHMEAPAEAAEA